MLGFLHPPPPYPSIISSFHNEFVLKYTKTKPFFSNYRKFTRGALFTCTVPWIKMGDGKKRRREMEKLSNGQARAKRTHTNAHSTLSLLMPFFHPFFASSFSSFSSLSSTYKEKNNPPIKMGHSNLLHVCLYAPFSLSLRFFFN